MQPMGLACGPSQGVVVKANKRPKWKHGRFAKLKQNTPQSPAHFPSIYERTGPENGKVLKETLVWATLIRCGGKPLEEAAPAKVI